MGGLEPEITQLYIPIQQILTKYSSALTYAHITIEEVVTYHNFRVENTAERASLDHKR